VKAALERVLLVEDNDDVRKVAQAALTLVGGLDVHACASGAAALAAMADFAPQLVLLDLMMPDMDGPAVLERLRADPATAGIPVVFLTAKASPAESRRLRELGALEVLAKPFDPLTLHERVKAIWKASV